MPEATVNRCFVFFDAVSVLNDIGDAEVRGDENTGASKLRCLVFLINRETRFVTNGLDEVDAETFHRFVIQIFKHNMRMFAGVVQIEELVVQILLEVIRVDKAKDSSLARTWVTIQPNVRITVRLEEVLLLGYHSLDTFPID